MKEKILLVFVIVSLLIICFTVCVIVELIDNNFSIFKTKPSSTNTIPKVTHIINYTSKGFTIGSSMEEVIKYMGIPTDKSIYKKLNEEVWYYNSSRIYFKNKKVYNFSDCDNNLILKGKVIEE